MDRADRDRSGSRLPAASADDGSTDPSGNAMMGIAQKVSRNFSDAVRSRGQSYFVKGRVTVIGGRAGEVVAKVRGTAKYRVRVRLRGSKLLASCTCPYFSPQGEPCKHLWATLLLADARGLLQSPPVRPAEAGRRGPRRSPPAGLPSPRPSRAASRRRRPIGPALGSIGLGAPRPAGPAAPGGRGPRPRAKDRGAGRAAGRVGAWSQPGPAPRDRRASRPAARSDRDGHRPGAAPGQGGQPQRQAAAGLRPRRRRHAHAEPGGHRPGPPPAAADRRLGPAEALVARAARRRTSSTTPRTASSWPCSTRPRSPRRPRRSAARPATAPARSTGRRRSRAERLGARAGSCSARTRRRWSSGWRGPAGSGSGGPRARTTRRRCAGTTASPGGSRSTSAPSPAASAGPGAARSAAASDRMDLAEPLVLLPGLLILGVGRAARFDDAGRHALDRPAPPREGDHLRRAAAGPDARPDPGRDPRRRRRSWSRRCSLEEIDAKPRPCLTLRTPRQNWGLGSDKLIGRARVRLRRRRDPGRAGPRRWPSRPSWAW